MLEWLFGARVPVIEGADLSRRLSGPDAPYLVDVRTPGEFRQGHIPGAHLIPLGQIGARLNEIPKGRDVVTVCRSGHRSAAAGRQLMKAGYQVQSLKGGMMVWQGKVQR